MYQQLTHEVDSIVHTIYKVNNYSNYNKYRKPKPRVSLQNYKCIRCGTENCFAIKLKCHSCGKIGHTAKACKSKPTHHVRDSSPADISAGDVRVTSVTSSDISSNSNQSTRGQVTLYQRSHSPPRMMISQQYNQSRPKQPSYSLENTGDHDTFDDSFLV